TLNHFTRAGRRSERSRSPGRKARPRVERPARMPHSQIERRGKVEHRQIFSPDLSLRAQPIAQVDRWLNIAFSRLPCVSEVGCHIDSRHGTIGVYVALDLRSPEPRPISRLHGIANRAPCTKANREQYLLAELTQRVKLPD